MIWVAIVAVVLFLLAPDFTFFVTMLACAGAIAAAVATLIGTMTLPQLASLAAGGAVLAVCGAMAYGASRLASRFRRC